MLGITTPLYRALSSTDVSSETSYVITANTNFYAAPDVIEITDQAGINAVRANLGGKYILLSDISLNAAANESDVDNGWDPIGNISNPFTGIFSGNGNTISNLWINRTTTENVGLFGYTNNAQIKNLGVEAVEVKGQYYVGIIAGTVGYSNITNSYSTGNVNGYGYVGGIAGVVQSSSITNSYSKGNVNGDGGDGYVGGIAGYLLTSSAVTNSYSAGTISGANRVGGIAGSVYNYSSVTNSYSTGSVSGTNQLIGGIAGSVIVYSTITNSYSAGNVSGNSWVGGIAGHLYSSSVTNNAAINPSVTGSTDINRAIGFIGNSYGTNNISNNFALEDMTDGTNTLADGGFISGSNDNKGISKTELELKTKVTYSNAVNGDGNGGLGWKFGNDADNPWNIDPNKNNGYPYLYWE